MNLEERLESEKIWHRFIEKPETVHTVDAARETGVDLAMLTKNLVARTKEGEYVLLIVPGNTRIDLKKGAELLGSKNVSLVPFDQAERVSGYPPGATPSIFHKQNLRTIVDIALLKNDTLYCGGGVRNRILELRVNDVIRLDGAIVADIQKKDEGNRP
jgi:Cys-tRNA(Pro)/Cys-tRNA(Cys) deacylase